VAVIVPLTASPYAPASRDARGEAHLPDSPHHEEEADRRGRHRAVDGQSVRARQSRRRAEANDQRDAADHQERVDGRHVDLPGLFVRRVEDRQARQETEVHGLAGQRECARDQRLGCDHRGRRRERDERIAKGVRRHCEERIVDRGRRPQQQRALAGIGQR